MSVKVKKELPSCKVAIEPLPNLDLRCFLNKRKNTTLENNIVFGNTTPTAEVESSFVPDIVTGIKETDTPSAQNEIATDAFDTFSCDLSTEAQLLGETDDISVTSYNINEDALLYGVESNQGVTDDFKQTSDFEPINTNNNLEPINPNNSYDPIDTNDSFEPVNINNTFEPITASNDFEPIDKNDQNNNSIFNGDIDTSCNFDLVSLAAFDDEFNEDDIQSTDAKTTNTQVNTSSTKPPENLPTGLKRKNEDLTEPYSKVNNWKDRYSDQFKAPLPRDKIPSLLTQPIANLELLKIINQSFILPTPPVNPIIASIPLLNQTRQRNYNNNTHIGQRQAFVKPMCIDKIPKLNVRNDYNRKRDNTVPAGICQSFWYLGVCNNPKPCQMKHERKNSNANKLAYKQNDQYRHSDHEAKNKGAGSPTKHISAPFDCPKGYCFEYWQLGRCSKKKCSYNHMKRGVNAGVKPFSVLNNSHQTHAAEQNKGRKVSESNGGLRPSVTPLHQFNNRNANELLEELQYLTNIDRAWLIIQQIRDRTSGNSPSYQKIDESKFRHGIEHTLLCIKENTNHDNAEIATQLVEMKRAMLKLKWEDLFVHAQVLANVGRINNAVDVLQELLTTFDRNRIDSNDMEKLLFLCTDKRGLVLKIWDYVKNYFVNSERLLDKFFVEIEMSVLSPKIKAETLTCICKKLIDGSLVLSNDARKTYLKLFTPCCNIGQLTELLNAWVDFNVVPVITLEKLLLSIQTNTNVVAAISLLERMPLYLCSSSSQSFNEAVVSLCKNGGQCFDVVEKIYLLMRKASIQLTEESILRVLNMMCANKKYDLFVTRYDEITEQGIVPADLTIPDWFASTLADALETGPDKVHHKMVLCLLSTKIPPEERRISQVLNLLIAKRRFPDILDLVKKCLDRSYMLSQKELRRVVLILEEWTANTEASIFVYTKMREIYPRPEHQCVCGKKVDTSYLRSKFQYSETFQKSCDDDRSSADSNGSVFNQEEVLATAHRELLRISAELNQNGEDSSKFKELYMEAVSMDAANNNIILNGLFLGLTNNERPGYKFNIFIRLLMQTYTNAGNDIELPEDVSLASGRLAVRVIRYLHNRESFSEAYTILHTCHEHLISYSHSGGQFGTMMETNEDMSVCSIANLCSDVCIRNNKIDSGYHVLKHCQYGVPESGELDENELSERNNRAGRLIEGLLQIRMAIEAWDTFLNVHATMSIPVKTKLINEVCTSFCELNLPEEALKVSNEMNKLQLDVHRRTVKAYVNCLALNDHNPEALEMFRKGIAIKAYGHTYDKDRPYQILLSTDLSRVEIRLLVEQHFKDLRMDPAYEELLAKSIDMMDSFSPFEFTVVPSHDQDLVEFKASKERTYQDLIAFANELTPPLEIIEKSEQRIVVSHPSVYRWTSHQFLPSNDHPRSLAPLVKKKRTIAVPDAPLYDVACFSNMTMTICPTPKPFDTTEECASVTDIPVIVNVPTKRNVLIKDYPDTENAVEAEKYIRKTICAELTALMKKGIIQKEHFVPIAKKLHKSFLATMQGRGPIFFDKNISLEASKFVVSNFKNFLHESLIK